MQYVQFRYRKRELVNCNWGRMQLAPSVGFSSPTTSSIMGTKQLKLQLFLFLLLLPLFVKGQGEHLRSIIRQRLAEYKREAQIALNLKDNGHGRRRSKRAVIIADNLTLERTRRKSSPIKPYDEGSHMVTKILRISPQYFDHVETLDINSASIHNQTFMATLELEKTSGIPQVALYRMLSGLQPKEIARRNAPNATSIELVEIDKSWYILPLSSSNSNSSDEGSPLLKIDLVRRSLTQVQLLRTGFAHSSFFWSGSGAEANNVFLGVAPEWSDDGTGRKSAKVEIGFYRWQGGYFDEISKVSASNPQAISHFNILNNDYFAVANYQDDTGSTSVHSEIFKYYYKESRFASFQSIRTFGAKDVRHFTLRNGGRAEHFLAIANHCVKDEAGRPDYRVKSLIMKFAERRFIPFKSIYTNGALQFLPVTVGGKSYLALLEIEQIRILQYNGWSFVQVERYPLAPLGNLMYSMKMRPFPFENQPYFAVSSTSEDFKGGIFSVQFDARNDYNALTEGLEKWCLAARARLDSVDVKRLEAAVDQSAKSDAKEILLKRPLTFKGPLTATSITTEKTKFKGIEFDDKLAKTLDGQEKDVERLSESISSLEEQMRTVVFRDENTVISGKIIFDNVHYDNSVLKGAEADIKILNGVNVKQFVNSLIFTNSEMQINSLHSIDVIFASDPTVETLNGAPLSDYALTDGNGNFTKSNVFSEQATIFGDNTIAGLFGGVDFTKPNFILAQGNQTFQDPVRIRNSSVTRLYTRLLNGEDIVHYFRDAVPLDGDVEIDGYKTFNNVSLEELQVDGSVNGKFFIERLYASAIYTKGVDSQGFTGITKLKNFVTDGNVELDNRLVNGKYDLTKDFVNVKNGSYQFGEIVLSEGGTIEDLRILRQLNHLEIGREGDFGLFLTNSEQVQRIRNKRIIGNLHFNTDVVADRFFDGVSLKDWSPEQIIVLRRSSFGRKFVVHGNFSAPNVTVKRKFDQDGHNLLHILHNIANLNDTKLPGNCTLVFENLIVEGNTDVRKEINNQRPSDWLLKSTKAADVKGTKIFLEDVTLEDDANAKSLFSRLAPAENILPIIQDLLLDGINQTISGPTTFLSLLKVDKLDCPGILLDGIPFSKLLFREGSQEIDVDSTFGRLVIAENSVGVKGNLSLGLINGKNFTKDVEETLRTISLTTQIVQGEWEFEEGLTLKELETDGLVENINLGKLLASLVRKDRKEPLSLNGTSLIFDEGLQVENLFLDDGSLNSIHVDEWGRLWLLNDHNQTVETPVEFKDGLKVDSGIWVTDGNVGPINVPQLDVELLRIDGPAHLHNVHFITPDPVEIKGLHLSPKATLNGLHVERDLLHKNFQKGKGPQKITGAKTFEQGFESEGDLSLRKLNGVDPTPAAHFLYSKNPKEFRRQKLLVKGNLHLVTEPHASKFVNGFDLEQLLRKVWFTNSDVVLKSRPSFAQLVLLGGGEFDKGKKLNGVDLHHLVKNYVSKSKNQEWIGKVKFESDVDISRLEVDGEIKTEKFNNEQDFNQFLESLLTNGTNQNIEWNAGLLSIDTIHLSMPKGRKVNGIDLDKDFVTLHGHNRLGDERSVGAINASELEFSSTNLNGILLSNWDSIAMKTNANRQFHQNIVINSGGLVKNLRVKGLVDGIKFDSGHILLKKGDQVLKGKANLGQFEADKGIKLKGLFNGQNLNDTLGTLVRKSDNSPIHVGGRKEFLYPIYVDHIQTRGLFKGENLTKILHEHYSGAVIPEHLQFRAKENYEELGAFAKYAFHVSQRRPIWLEYFVLSRVIDDGGFAATTTQSSPTLPMPLKSSPDHSAVIQVGNKTLLALVTEGQQEGEGVVEIWSSKTASLSNQFEKESCIPVFNPVGLDAIFASNYIPFLVVASGSLPSRNYLGAVFIYRYSEEKNEFEKIQTLEVDSPKQLKLYSMLPSKELFIFVLTHNPSNNVLVYKFHGVSGWSLEHKFSSPGAESLEVGDVGDEYYHKAQLIISSVNQTRIYSGIFKGIPWYPQGQAIPQKDDQDNQNWID